MSRLCISVIFLLLLFPFSGEANNIRIDSVSYVSTSVAPGQTTLRMTFTVVWENSWRDDYNYDAAYVFFKFKRKDTDPRRPQEWNHLFLSGQGHVIDPDFADNYDFWLSPLSSAGTDFNPGIYIFRKEYGRWNKDSVRMTVAWNVVNQMVSNQLTPDDIRNGSVQISGHAIEMVYVPRGAYRLGDGVSDKGFRRQIFPILAEYDIVSRRYKTESSNVSHDTTAAYAADRVNDNTGNALSEWRGTGSGPWWWSIDFGKNNYKRITYFGINSPKGAGNYPTRFALLGTQDPDITNVRWDTLWSGSGKDHWITALDAYPAEKAIAVSTPGNYRAYKLVIFGMNTGTPQISTIGMTEKDLRSLIDYSVLIDRTETDIDSVRKLGAGDGTSWVTGTKIPRTFPNGYSSFYAMKYELSQDQYVRFLNKLTYRQQNGLLGNRLGELKEGDYIFGDRTKPDCRNGIILATKIDGLPAVFACNLDGDDLWNQPGDGENIACNYVNIQDMLAYADWSCLRPLSEMEYEKMCRPYYPSVPVRGSYAWGTTVLEAPGEITGGNTASERAGKGNANWGKSLAGPLRVGAFARNSSPGIRQSGAGFWGCLDLSGNLSEMYYNANQRGLELVTEQGAGNTPAGHETSHGDGSLDGDGHYNGVKSRHWTENQDAIALRGGSYASAATLLRTSDRTWNTGYFKNMLERDSTVTFRLGRTAPTYPEIRSWLITENEVTTEGGHRSDFFLNTSSYIIKGNKPVNPQGGLISYIWYSQESAGEWKVMEGEINQTLFFDKYRNDTIVNTVNGLNFNFKRKAFTPYTDSEASSEYQVGLITNPFDKALETFTYTGNTYQMQCNWDVSIPRRWRFDQDYPGLSIHPETGVISGLNQVMCNVTVILVCTNYPERVYQIKVKETRDFGYTGGVQTITLPPGEYVLECWGGSGSLSRINGTLSGRPGYGGYAYGVLPVLNHEKFFLNVGGVAGTPSNTAGGTGGWNGGATGGGDYDDDASGGGGGATDIRLVTGNLYSRIMVAGGGGGCGWGATGGGGGGINGNSANVGGGSQTSGAGFGNGGGGGYGGNGHYGGGGGGGGYYGGYGAGQNVGSGGGGSGFVSGLSGCNAVNSGGGHTGRPEHYSGYVFKNPRMLNDQRNGNGLIRITAK